MDNRTSIATTPRVDPIPESRPVGDIPSDQRVEDGQSCDTSENTPPSDNTDIEAASALFGATRSSKNFSVGFLAKELGGGKSKWGFAKSKNQFQNFHESILGSVSASRSRQTLGRLLCPCLSDAVRREEEFKTEMRVLSRVSEVVHS